jgi:hypothetical protein
VRQQRLALTACGGCWRLAAAAAAAAAAGLLGGQVMAAGTHWGGSTSSTMIGRQQNVDVMSIYHQGSSTSSRQETVPEAALHAPAGSNALQLPKDNAVC